MLFRRLVGGSALAGLAWIAFASTSQAADIVGTLYSVVDGDTFDVCNQNGCVAIRLCGVDAPEQHEKGFKESVLGLDKIAGAKSVRCRPVEEGTVCDGKAARTSGNRIIAQCFLNGTNVDIGMEMVAGGFACDWVRYSGGYYSENNNGVQCTK